MAKRQMPLEDFKNAVADAIACLIKLGDNKSIKFVNENELLKAIVDALYSNYFRIETDTEKVSRVLTDALAIAQVEMKIQTTFELAPFSK